MTVSFTGQQQEFLDAEGKVVVKACPGSGKTFMVAHKLLSYLNSWTDPFSGVAVLSFTNVASREINEKTKEIYGRLVCLGQQHFIGTVDSFIDEFIVLRYGHLTMPGNVRPRILITDSLKLQNYWDSECHRKRCVDNMDKFYYGADGQFYNGNKIVSCKQTGNGKLPCQKYIERMKRKGFIFQSETAAFAHRLLREYPKIAMAVSERFPVIIIDEAQDTSTDQMAVFDVLSDSGVSSMFLVGDTDQAIYEWRNANPRCLLDKQNDPGWRTIELNGNFRCSQNICNVTAFFAAGLRGADKNTAVGKWKDEPAKPILLLTGENDLEEDIVNYFLGKCDDMGIGRVPENIAVLTRGRVYSESGISDIWRSKEIRLFAEAAYEWKHGSRKNAYKKTFRAAYNIIFGDADDEYIMMQNIRERYDEDTWRDFILTLLAALQTADTGLSEWVNTCKERFVDISGKYNFRIPEKEQFKEFFKIKSRDKEHPQLKKTPLERFFMGRFEREYTRSSIHGVKGESFDAVLLYIKSTKGTTITPKLLMDGDLNKEEMRLAYVAMTRARRLLVVAMPYRKGLEECKRFSKEFWNWECLG